MSLDKRITTVMLDLDGTLLPMDAEVFTNAYFSEIAKKAVPLGYEPKAVIAGIWSATKKMMANDGSKANIDVFWENFQEEMGENSIALKEHFDDFYTREFHNVKAATGENAAARELIDGLKAGGLEIIVATNPVFPLDGNLTRLSWVDLKRDDFIYITAYENSSFCKPNPAYYKEILEKTGKKPEECLMVGNDVKEDMAAQKAGIETYLVTDCLINSGGEDISKYKHGSFAEMMEYLEMEK